MFTKIYSEPSRYDPGRKVKSTAVYLRGGAPSIAAPLQSGTAWFPFLCGGIFASVVGNTLIGSVFFSRKPTHTVIEWSLNELGSLNHRPPNRNGFKTRLDISMVGSYVYMEACVGKS
jgi:hypothetical protein